MKRTINAPIDGGSISSIVFDHYAGGNKQARVALKLNFLDVKSDAFLLIKKGQNLYIFNKSSTLGWIKMGKDTDTDTSISANFSANEFPIKPMDWTILNSGDFQKIVKSNVDIGVYVAHDDSVLKD